jgi:hypothetical protein
LADVAMAALVAIESRTEVTDAYVARSLVPVWT